MSTRFKKLSLVLALVLAFSLAAPAQEAAETGAVKVSWEEFKKLLDLGKDEIVLSWAEFQQIIAQTDTKIVPAFELRDEKVVLTRAQFRNLLEKMKPPDIDRHRAAGGVAVEEIGLQGPARRRRGARAGRHLRRCLPRDSRRLCQPPPLPGADRRPRHPAERLSGPDRNPGRTLHGLDGQGGTAPDRRGFRPARDRRPGPGDLLPRSQDPDHDPRVRPSPPRARGRSPGRPTARSLGTQRRDPCLRRPDPDRDRLPQMAEEDRRSAGRTGQDLRRHAHPDLGRRGRRPDQRRDRLDRPSEHDPGARASCPRGLQHSRCPRPRGRRLARADPQGRDLSRDPLRFSEKGQLRRHGRGGKDPPRRRPGRRLRRASRWWTPSGKRDSWESSSRARPRSSSRAFRAPTLSMSPSFPERSSAGRSSRSSSGSSTCGRLMPSSSISRSTRRSG